MAPPLGEVGRGPYPFFTYTSEGPRPMCVMPVSSDEEAKERSSSEAVVLGSPVIAI